MTDDSEVESVFRAETAVLFDDAEGHLLAVERACRVLDQEWRALLGSLHTIKGNCGMVGRELAESACHELEHQARDVRERSLAQQADGVAELLAGLDDVRRDAFGKGQTSPTVAQVESALPPESGTTPAPATASRPWGAAAVGAARLDALLDVTDDVVTMLERLATLPRAAPVPSVVLAELSHSASRSVRTLRHNVMELRLVPLRTLLGRYVRPLHDLARTKGKQIDVQLQVGELAVDREIADRLSEPLLHVLRNAVDHGVEPPVARARVGKAERATIAIRAEVSAGRMMLVIRDDGRGIDVAALRAEAERRNIALADIDHAALLDLVFAPELSTSPQTTLTSGRGVGLDQSRRAIEAMGGTITVNSEAGAWTELRLRVPLALAMQRALVVRRADIRYAVPFRSTIEITRWVSVPAGGASAIPWRERMVPLVAPADGFMALARQLRTGVVVSYGDDVAAIDVEEILGYQDVTIRRLDGIFGRPRGISGAALALDGGVVLVLDPDTLERVRAPEAA
ncbi:MAG TPA: ATP-binding protein [Kofleriaceae bacterium]|nr:ATP-binding protein [Kofleriaceae bacterium]